MKKIGINLMGNYPMTFPVKEIRRILRLFRYRFALIVTNFMNKCGKHLPPARIEDCPEASLKNII